MKYIGTRFKSPELALKELEPFIRKAVPLQTGKSFEKFGDLRPRELLTNWLLCAVFNSERKVGGVTFTSDPNGGDGIIVDTATEEGMITEHVSVIAAPGEVIQDIEAGILEAINSKWNKGGEAYARGKHLVVFVDTQGDQWHPNKVARRLPDPLHFGSVWAVGLQGVSDGEYVYAVTHLDVSDGNAPVWFVTIGKDFDSWKVRPAHRPVSGVLFQTLGLPETWFVHGYGSPGP